MNLADMFCGAGGWSFGFRNATGHDPAIGINHDVHAIRVHKLNHPTTTHYCESAQDVDPIAACRGRNIGWFHMSPACSHFSRARGGKPKENPIRSLAWIGVNWADKVRPPIVSLENTVEFEDWGPLLPNGKVDPARVGETFREFVEELSTLGYRSEWRVLCAADYGAPTIRRRLFLIARRDGMPIVWPEPTHGPGRARPWRTAAECIDWSIPCPSIFGRKKPLADATCRRIAAGIVRYVLQGKPFMVTLTHGSRARGVDEPLTAITAQGGKHALVAAFLARHYTGMVGEDLRKPMPTVTAIDHHSLVAATLLTNNSNNAPQRADAPLGTVTTGGRHALVASFLTQYYGTGGQHSRANAPLPAVVTKSRHGLVTVDIDGESFVLSDIGLRMLEPRELARAQGFPDSYVLEGTKAEQIARIGNSVVPQIAEAIVRANTPALEAVA